MPADSAIPELSWNQDNIEYSLRELYYYCEKRGQGALDWYYRHKRGPALASRSLRLLAVFFTTMGGLCPIFKSTFPGFVAPANVDLPPLGYFFLAFAGACVAADRYLGYSSSWSRSILAATAINVALEDFRMNWARMTAIRRGERPTNAQIADLLESCKTLNSTIQKIMQEETVSWDKELRALQYELEGKTKAATASGKSEN